MINSFFTFILFAQTTLVPPDSFVYPLKVDTLSELELAIFPPKNAQPPLSYMIDWGDGETLKWTEPILALHDVYHYHRYHSIGSFAIKVRAKDAGERISLWSNPCSVQVSPALVKWFFPTLEPVVAAPALDENGNIYIGDESGTFYSLSPAGAMRWTFSARGPIYGAGAIANGRIYLPALDSHLYCLDTLGKLQWSVNLGDELWSSPAIANDKTTYLLTDKAKFISLNPQGKIRWSIQLGEEATSSPTIGPNGLIYVAADSVYCFNSRGKRRWAFGTSEGSYFFAAPVIDEKGLIYAGNFDGFIYCLGQDGRLRWRSPVQDEDEIRTEVVFGPDGTIYCGTDGYYLCAKPATGTVKTLYEAQDAICATPAISANGTIYFLADDGIFYAINTGGRIVFTQEIAGGDKDIYYSSSPAIAPDGTVYIGSWDGGVYALYGDAPLAKTVWPQFRQNGQRTGRLTIQKGR